MQSGILLFPHPSTNLAGNREGVIEVKRKIFLTITVLCVIFSIFSVNVFADYYSDNTTLHQGNQGSSVRSLQNDLSWLGYFDGTQTGYFGGYTRNSVIRFQKSHYLVPDGIVGHRTARQIKVERVAETAKRYQGVPYRWGGKTPSGFDCSGFTSYVLNVNGIYAGRTAQQQYEQGYWAAKTNLNRGDLVFFSTYKPGPSHVGIYLGNGKFINASSGWGKIVISDLSNSYFAEHYLGAKRIIR
jgi:hypothetical protein